MKGYADVGADQLDVRHALDDDADRDRGRGGRDVRQARHPRVRQRPRAQHRRASARRRRPSSRPPEGSAADGLGPADRASPRPMGALRRDGSRSSPAPAAASARRSPGAWRRRVRPWRSPPARSTSATTTLAGTLQRDGGRHRGRRRPRGRDRRRPHRRRRPGADRARGRSRARPGRHPRQQRGRRLLPADGGDAAEAAPAAVRAQRARPVDLAQAVVPGMRATRRGLDRQHLERDVEAPQGSAVRAGPQARHHVDDVRRVEGRARALHHRARGRAARRRHRGELARARRRGAHAREPRRSSAT